MAARYNQVRGAQFLLRYPATPLEAVNAEGRTAMDVALGRNNRVIARLIAAAVAARTAGDVGLPPAPAPLAETVEEDTRAPCVSQARHAGFGAPPVRAAPHARRCRM
jgi:hypothetical protein